MPTGTFSDYGGNLREEAREAMSYSKPIGASLFTRLSAQVDETRPSGMSDASFLQQVDVPYSISRDVTEEAEVPHMDLSSAPASVEEAVETPEDELEELPGQIIPKRPVSRPSSSGLEAFDPVLGLRCCLEGTLRRPATRNHGDGR